MSEGYVLQELQMQFPFLHEDAVDIREGDRLELILSMRDGSTVVYDGLNQSFRTLKERDESVKQNLTEQEWRDEFSRKLERKMMLKGVPQERLSELTGISKVMLSRYTNGKSTPSSYNLHKIAEALEIDISELTTFLI